MRKACHERAHHPVNPTHSLEVVLCEVSQADRLIEILLPALNTTVNADRNIALLAHSATEAPRLIASRQMRQRISQIVKLATVKQLGRHVVLQPEHLWDFHLNAHLTTNIP